MEHDLEKRRTIERSPRRQIIRLSGHRPIVPTSLLTSTSLWCEDILDQGCRATRVWHTRSYSLIFKNLDEIFMRIFFHSWCCRRPPGAAPDRKFGRHKKCPCEKILVPSQNTKSNKTKWRQKINKYYSHGTLTGA